MFHARPWNTDKIRDFNAKTFKIISRVAIAKND
jgi:hypothetical protein